MGSLFMNEAGRRASPGLAAALALLFAVATAAAPGAASTELEVGDRAPAFSLRGSDGKVHSLEAMLAAGKRGVVLAWFPKAFTPG